MEITLKVTLAEEVKRFLEELITTTNGGHRPSAREINDAMQAVETVVARGGSSREEAEPAPQVVETLTQAPPEPLKGNGVDPYSLPEKKRYMAEEREAIETELKRLGHTWAAKAPTGQLREMLLAANTPPHFNSPCSGSIDGITPGHSMADGPQYTPKPAAEPAQETAQPPVTSEVKPQEDSIITHDTIREEMKKLYIHLEGQERVDGIAKARTVLTEFGVATIQDLTPDQYAPVLDRVKEVLNG